MTSERILLLNNTYFIIAVLHLTSLGQFQLRQPRAWAHLKSNHCKLILQWLLGSNLSSFYLSSFDVLLWF